MEDEGQGEQEPILVVVGHLARRVLGVNGHRGLRLLHLDPYLAAAGLESQPGGQVHGHHRVDILHHRGQGHGLLTLLDRVGELHRQALGFQGAHVHQGKEVAVTVFEEVLGLQESVGDDLVILAVLGARGGDLVPQEHADQGHAAIPGHGHVGAARGVGAAGLATDAPGVEGGDLLVVPGLGLVHQPIDVPDGDGAALGPFGDGILLGGQHLAEGVVLRRRRPQNGEIPGRGVHVVVVEARGVGEMAVGHAQLLGFLVHQLREAAFRAAHLLRHGLSSVTARGEEHAVHQVQQPIHLALLHADLGVGAG